MEKIGFSYNGFLIYPCACRSVNNRWRAHADISCSNGNEDLLEPNDWQLPEFDTEQEAQQYALDAAKNWIDSGRCNI